MCARRLCLAWSALYAAYPSTTARHAKQFPKVPVQHDGGPARAATRHVASLAATARLAFAHMQRDCPFGPLPCDTPACSAGCLPVLSTSSGSGPSSPICFRKAARPALYGESAEARASKFPYFSAPLPRPTGSSPRQSCSISRMSILLAGQPQAWPYSASSRTLATFTSPRAGAFPDGFTQVADPIKMNDPACTCNEILGTDLSPYKHSVICYLMQSGFGCMLPRCRRPGMAHHAGRMPDNMGECPAGRCHRMQSSQELDIK